MRVKEIRWRARGRQQLLQLRCTSRRAVSGGGRSECPNVLARDLEVAPRRGSPGLWVLDPFASGPNLPVDQYPVLEFFLDFHNIRQFPGLCVSTMTLGLCRCAIYSK